MTDILNTRNGGFLLFGGLILGGYLINEFFPIVEKGMTCGYNASLKADKYGTLNFTKGNGLNAVVVDEVQLTDTDKTAAENE